MVSSRRLQIAREISAELRQREGRNLLAVGVYGSVARGEDRPFSDVDLVMLVRTKRRRPRLFVRDGILVSLLQMTPQEARDEVHGSPWNLPEALSGWRSMRILYDRSGVLRRLKIRARHPKASQFRAVVRRDFLGVYEDYGKLRNALQGGDSDEAREMAIWFTQGALMLLFCLERHVVRTGRQLFVELRAFGSLGNAIRRLRYESLSNLEAGRLARLIWSSLVRRAREEGLRLPEAP